MQYLLTALELEERLPTTNPETRKMSIFIIRNFKMSKLFIRNCGNV